MRTLYAGEMTDTELKDLHDEVTAYCPNDECPGLEVEIDDPEEGPVEVRRIAWDTQPVGASGPSYACGGEPGYDRYPECPECGASGEGL